MIFLLKKSDEPDTYESLFGSCKGCEHAPTTYEEYCLHACCPDAYTDKAVGCKLFKKQGTAVQSRSIKGDERQKVRKKYGRYRVSN